MATKTQLAGVNRGGILFEGNLDKKEEFSNSRDSWKTRYFVLYEDRLLGYRDRETFKDKSPNYEEISLLNVKTIINDESRDDKLNARYVFELVMANGTSCMLACFHRRLTNLWVKSICIHLLYAKCKYLAGPGYQHKRVAVYADVIKLLFGEMRDYRKASLSAKCLKLLSTLMETDEYTSFVNLLLDGYIYTTVDRSLPFEIVDLCAQFYSVKSEMIGIGIEYYKLLLANAQNAQRKESTVSAVRSVFKELDDSMATKPLLLYVTEKHAEPDIVKAIFDAMNSN